MSNKDPFQMQGEKTEKSLSIFNDRIVTMMKDYQISMRQALEWDFEGFENILQQSWEENMLEHDFKYYLWQNGIRDDYWPFYADIFMGRANDMGLKKRI